MNRLVQALLLGITGLVVLAAAGPTIGRLGDALVPLVLAVGIVIALWKLVNYYTRS
jgi:hypothetical protein